MKESEDMKNIKRVLTTTGATVLGAMATSPVFAQVDTSLGGDAPLLGTATPQKIIGNVINVALGFLAFVAVVIILYGGFLWMTAAGNEEKVEQAKKLLVAALIGLVIILAAWGISLYAISTLAGATGTVVQ